MHCFYREHETLISSTSCIILWNFNILSVCTIYGCVKPTIDLMQYSNKDLPTLVHLNYYQRKVQLEEKAALSF